MLLLTLLFSVHVAPTSVGLHLYYQFVTLSIAGTPRKAAISVANLLSASKRAKIMHICGTLVHDFWRREKPF
jgi:hypothetical protein